MNAKQLFLALPLLVALPSLAQEGRPKFDVLMSPKAAAENPRPPIRAEALTPRRETPPFTLGNSNLVVNGPLIEGLRRRPAEDRSPGQTILDLPVIRLFVPQPMPTPPAEGGNYFAWGESSRPWVSVATGTAAASGGFVSPVNHEPKSALITVQPLKER